ncbi:diacylglycerol kinase [Sporosarcina luteola]|uniref:Diacylglycerol kinase n=1 Tax=Sporosarcina luteola TaxID=582850 RepID=A0A511ZA93_9BACL|nr:diacylglycerol kinase family protein [Sporosarcina luteola]GEN84351.1 diacylglycerol kinase [Sporosarcina luteola]
MHPFFKSFQYAIKGILHGVRSERNLKFHVFAAAVVLSASYLTGLSANEWMIIIILIGGMIALELVNTAVEKVVDLITEDFHPLAGLAKDLAAGAVLVFAVCSAIIGMIIFIPKWFI